MEYYTVDEVAELLKVPRKRITELIKSGELKAFKMGARTCRITQAMLDEYISKNALNTNRK